MFHQLPIWSTERGAVTVLSLIVAISGCADELMEPIGKAGLIEPARACQRCHPQYVEEWKHSVHAHASFSPIMRRLNEIGQGLSDGNMGKACFPCHSPAAVLLDEIDDPLDPDFSEVGAEGIACDFCHILARDLEVGVLDFSSYIGEPGVRYANMADPMPTEFHGNESLAFYSKSQICAPCHQLSTADGVEFENSFREWDDSGLAAAGMECQTCHMPTYTGRAAPGAPLRDNLHRHDFASADYPRSVTPGVDVEAIKDATKRMLKISLVVAVEGVPSLVAQESNFDFTVAVTNRRVGHAIPSGVSFWREMWIEVTVVDAAGIPVYRSGYLEENGDLVSTEEDPDRASFTSIVFDEEGQRDPLPWDIATIDEAPMLQFGETRRVPYTIPVGSDLEGPLSLTVTIRFRPIVPQLLRDIDLEELLPIEIFDMWTKTYYVELGAKAEP